MALLAMMEPVVAAAAQTPLVEIGPKSSDVVQRYAIRDNATTLSASAKVALLRQKVKYVFVLFQENRSFDQHFGTFPGAEGLFSHPAAETPGFYQPIVNTDNSVGTISPFKITATIALNAGGTVNLYPEDTDSVDHSHTGIDNSLDFNASLVAKSDRYALNEEGLTTVNGQIVTTAGVPLAQAALRTEAQKQKGELVMGHLDCDTVPFLWQYADRFTLFDNFRQTVIGPSTPNAIAMIAGQSGVTQWALHPSEGSNNTPGTTLASSGGEPVVGDPHPFPGSNLDYSPIKPPSSPDDENPATPALNQTYASLPLSFMGRQITHTVQYDQNPALDLQDIQSDINTIASENLNPVKWRWYEEGYDHEPTDGTGPTTHENYIVHHEGPQYFGYIGDNTLEQKNLYGLADFFTDIAAKHLPTGGGVIYVRGGYGNNDGLVPRSPSPNVQKSFTGNDDHPGYSDAQISEALLADEVNAIASSPYWKDSAIIITYDETDGLYDHVAPHIRQLDPEGNPLGAGPRVPAIVISPYAVAHGIVHQESEHGSVIKFIDKLFGLTPLADLPDEKKGRAQGAKLLGQNYLEPSDGDDTPIGELFAAFDDGRLSGITDPLPASYAEIPASVVHTLPHYGGQGCYVLNIVPTDYVNGKLIDPPPADFNPRPGANPGIPAQGNWPTN
jgi:phospholipase C